MEKEIPLGRGLGQAEAGEVGTGQVRLGVPHKDQSLEVQPAGEKPEGLRLDLRVFRANDIEALDSRVVLNQPDNFVVNAVHAKEVLRRYK